MEGIDLNFNYGIERVSVRAPAARALPEGRGGLAPSEAPLSNELSALFENRSLAQQCLQLLRPTLVSSALLAPMAYQQQLRGALTTLQKMQGEAREPAQRQRLQSATQLLEGELENRALLDMYRQALLRG
jgi:hypothetical protein